jgi:hypothetical protein
MARSGGDGPPAKMQLEIYAQAYNLFNTPNFINYAGVLTSQFFGRPLAAMAARRIETGLRVSF